MDDFCAKPSLTFDESHFFQELQAHLHLNISTINKAKDLFMKIKSSERGF